MKRRTLVLRSLLYYWRTNLAVVLGVATAIAVLSGALLVGDSVRGSLRDLALQRIGNANQAVVSTDFFRDELARETIGVPLMILRGFVSVQGGDGRAGNVVIYGVTDSFWTFHGVSSQPLTGRETLISPALADELGTTADATLLVHLQRPSDIPLESLHGRKADPGITIRARVKAVQSREQMGEFSLQAQQGATRAVFLPLELLQRELGLTHRINALLLSSKAEELMRARAQLDDIGARLQSRNTGNLVLEPRSGVVSDTIAKAAEEFKGQGLLTYLANRMKVGTRELPYSLVTAMDMPEFTSPDSQEIILNEWAAKDLQAKVGDTLSMEYFYWEEPGRLITRSADFKIVAIVSRGDRRMAPEYPGITNAVNLRDWDPPFPVDLRRIRPTDEEYWKKYGTTPKAFIPLQTGQKLWRSRYGGLTSIRFDQAPNGLAERLRAKIDPLAAGLTVIDLRKQILEASRGATNFGEYFVYFSFFLVVSALLLAALFFRLGVEQRVREVGLLRAVGLPHVALRSLFLTEGGVLSALGAALGSAGAIGYGAGIIAALKTWWVDAVGTTDIELHVSAASLVIGASGGIVAALGCVALTLRGMKKSSERSLLAGGPPDHPASLRSAPLLKRRGQVALLLIALGLLAAGALKAIPADGAFFGGAFALLAAALTFFRYQLSQPSTAVLKSIPSLGLRNASHRPTRTIVAMATIASAAFILIAVDAFRKDLSSQSSNGLIVETLAPIAGDPNQIEGLQDFHFEPFRVRPGDDTSCLNLYEPKNPRILAPRDTYITKQTDPSWQLLKTTFDDGAIPVITDANSLTYVLHRKIGEDFVLPVGGRDVHLRFVAALSDSIFQSELLMSESNFLKLFPEQDGYSVLVGDDVPASAARKVEAALLDYDADATSMAARLATYHRVENTYLSTFQMLGALGLLLGTVGLAAVLLRNILERRRELALLKTLGYAPKDFFAMTVAENAAILLGGLLTGVVCAAIAVSPALLERGGRLPALTLLPLLGAVAIVGLVISLIATAAALRGSELAALRSE
jgi:putative ABC transport system permease protein